MSLATTGIAYVVLALQVKMGMPPIYKVWSFSIPSEKEALEITGAVFPAFLGFIVAAMTASAGINPIIMLVIWLLSAAMSFWSGFKIRSALRREVNGPLEWLAQRMPLQLAVILIRRPMFLFDLWTIGLAVICFFLRF